MPGVGPEDQPLAGVFSGAPDAGTIPPQGAPPAVPAVSDFLAVFPEFSAVPVMRIQFYLTLAIESLRPEFWQDRLFNAIILYVAHMLASTAKVATATGALPLGVGGMIGVVSSKSVGGVSKSMDTSSGQTEGGGSYNTTVYGQQFLSLRDSGGIAVFQL